MSVFLTGATGFVGANLAIRLVEQGEDVHILARPSSRLWRLESILKSLHVHDADLTDAPTLTALLAEIRPKTVFHLAAYGAYPHQNDARKIFETAIFGTLNLLEASKKAGVGLVINTGSSSEYGTKDHPMSEDDRLEPNSSYAVAKAAQTLLCQDFARREALPVITVRLFSVYGPFEEPTRLVPTIIRKTLKNEDLPLADPNTARDFIFAADVVDAYLALRDRADLSGEVLNLGSGRQTSLREIVETALALTGSTSKPIWGAYPSRPFDTATWVADMSHMQTKTGFTARTSLKDGLEKTISWLKPHLNFYETYAGT